MVRAAVWRVQGASGFRRLAGFVACLAFCAANFDMDIAIMLKAVQDVRPGRARQHGITPAPFSQACLAMCRLVIPPPHPHHPAPPPPPRPTPAQADEIRFKQEAKTQLVVDFALRSTDKGGWALRPGVCGSAAHRARSSHDARSSHGLRPLQTGPFVCGELAEAVPWHVCLCTWLRTAISTRVPLVACWLSHQRSP